VGLALNPLVFQATVCNFCAGFIIFVQARFFVQRLQGPTRARKRGLRLRGVLLRDEYPLPPRLPDINGPQVGARVPQVDAHAHERGHALSARRHRGRMGSGRQVADAVVRSDPGALREEGRQLPGLDQGGLHPALAPPPAPLVPFEIVSKSALASVC
jgi:hypothetical protein